jgi:hypothetical protein
VLYNLLNVEYCNMYMRANEIRVTASITDVLARQFTDLTRLIGVSGSALISRTLRKELDYLAMIPSNSRRARKALEMVADADTGRINFTLCRLDAERMDAICKEKNVPRNIFLHDYIDFLCNGYPNVCPGPLTLVNKILTNPRYEYEQKKHEERIRVEKLAETLRMDPRDLPDARRKMELLREALSTPYSSLHLDEETIAEIVKIMTEANEVAENL